MRRLFFSLYLAVTLGLLFISWSSELLWQQMQSKQNLELNSEITRLKQLVKGYVTVLPATLSQSDVSVLQSEFPFSIKLINPQSLAFLPEQKELLANGQAIHLFDQEKGVSIFVNLQANKTLKFGPFVVSSEPNESSWLRNSLLILSYVLLALLILLWSRPLWRDLKLLQQQTESFSEGTPPSKNKIKRHSVIFPLSKAFHTMAARIQQLLTLQKQMTHAVSHDIRTPLARLKFSLEILDNQFNQEGKRISADMRQDVAEIETLIDEMLTYGRLEVSSSPLNIEQVDIFQLSQNLTEKLNRGSPIQIQLECPSSLMFQCDGHLLERALQNLLTNAQTYASSKVWLTIDNDPERLQISVTDDGEGIDKINKEKIFLPFTRLEKSRNKKSGGFGLGLAIVKKIINWHQGHIELSSYKQGAKFVISLPTQVNDNEIK